MRQRVLLLSVVILAVACGGQPGPAPERRVLSAGLQRLSSCSELDSAIREKARAAMNAELDKVVAAYTGGGMGPCAEYADDAGATNGGSTVAPSSVSQTNNQVVGVDEADLVKTDGQYLYLAQGTELRIVKAWPANETAIVSRVALAGTAKRLFAVENRVLVYSSVPRGGSLDAYGWMWKQGVDCTYGYDCDFSGDGSATQISIFDVTDRASPARVRTIDLPGSLIAARRIGTAVHTVVSIGEIGVPGLKIPYVNGCGGALSGVALVTKLAEIEQMRDRNDAKIDAAVFDVGVLAREGENVLGRMDCSDFYRETQPDGTGITTVLSLDLTSDTAPALSNVLSRAGAVYASESSLYMAVPHRQTSGGGWFEQIAGDEASTVHQFQIDSDPRSTTYLASGIVPGHVLNQFSMDEHGGDLRIATSKGWVPDPDVSSVVSVLRRVDGELATIGQVSGIAPTEDIRSVRFQGDRGYVVTFKKTDPLFVLDLADPTKPTVVGELKIPGFSTYMHPLDANHLLALGYEADEMGSFAYFNGIQLQIFDVTSPTKPALLHKKVYGTRGTSSSALTDHLGFTFLPERGLLTLPMSICDGGGNGMSGSLSFSGVVAMDVGIDTGITELGRLEEPYPASSDTQFRYGGACYDWWSDSNSVVRRTVVMDDFLYAISDNRVRVQDLGALGVDVKVVDM